VLPISVNISSTSFSIFKSGHSSDPKEKVLDETFTEPDNKYYSGLKQEELDKAFTGRGSKHSSGSKMKPEEITPLSEDDHGYEGILKRLFHTDCRMKQAPRAYYYRDRDSSHSE
jgi:hypothetical protein